MKYLKSILILYVTLYAICCSSPKSIRETQTNSSLSTEERATKQPVNPATSEEIVSALINDSGWADIDQLSRFSPNDEVRALVEEQSKATGIRAITIAYLLITLKQDYAANRGKILTMLQQCAQDISTEECEMAIDYAGNLLIEGDGAFLEPMIKLAPKSDGAIAEGIFSTFGYMLQRNPRLFLQGLKRLSSRQQHELGYMAGAMDGGGMDDEMLKDVRSKLGKIASQRRDRLAAIARICLMEIELANKEARTEERK